MTQPEKLYRAAWPTLAAYRLDPIRPDTAARSTAYYVAYSLASSNWLAYSKISAADALGRALMLYQDASADMMVVIEADHAPAFGNPEPPAGRVVWRGWNETSQNFRPEEQS